MRLPPVFQHGTQLCMVRFEHEKGTFTCASRAVRVRFRIRVTPRLMWQKKLVEAEAAASGIPLERFGLLGFSQVHLP